MEQNTKNMLERLGIDALSDMQQEAVGAFNENNDLIILSPTGSGKTLAYLLPLTERLNADNNRIQAVILSPTRELASQILSVFQTMKTPFKAMCCYGGRAAMEEHRVLKQLCPQVLIATPGRLCDHIRKENTPLEHVRFLIVDEFDKCMELGFRKEIAFIFDEMPPTRKNIFTSATRSDEISDFLQQQKSIFARRSVKTLNYLSPQGPSGESLIRQYIVDSPEKDKLATLGRLLLQLNGEPTIVFTNYRESVARVFRYLQENGFYCTAFHGAMEQDERERSLGKFRNGSCNVLVSTDLSSRGLDIPEVTNVIHYHIPLNQDTYTHRIGRSSRWYSQGNSYLILHGEEMCPDYIRAAHLCLEGEEPGSKKPVPPQWVTIYIGRGKKDKLSKGDIVGFICKKGNARTEDIGHIEVRDHYAYVALDRKKSRNILALLQNEKIKGMKTIFELMK